MTTPTHHIDGDHRPGRMHPAQWLVLGGVLLILLVAFPVQILAVAMFGASAMMLASIYVLWSQRHPIRPRRRTVRDHSVTAALVAVVAVGSVLAFIWPATTAVVAFAVCFTTCAVWFVVEHLPTPHHPSH